MCAPALSNIGLQGPYFVHNIHVGGQHDRQRCAYESAALTLQPGQARAARSAQLKAHFLRTINP
jgi:hypothetical protein